VLLASMAPTAPRSALGRRRQVARSTRDTACRREGDRVREMESGRESEDFRPAVPLTACD